MPLIGIQFNQALNQSFHRTLNISLNYQVKFFNFALGNLLEEIIKTGRENPQALLDAPVHTPVRRLDETAAARRMILTEDMAE